MMLSNEARPGVVSREVVRLAGDLMGWTWCSIDGWKNEKGLYVELVGAFDLACEELTVRHPWNPFTDANADVQVLERAKALWLPTYAGNAKDPWEVFRKQLLFSEWYTKGDYARAALAVLHSTLDPKV